MAPLRSPTPPRARTLIRRDRYGFMAHVVIEHPGGRLLTTLGPDVTVNSPKIARLKRQLAHIPKARPKKEDP
jgi:hypothetical protein